jgi:hypothetical protein
LKVITVSDHFKKVEMASSRAAVLTSLAMSFCRHLDSYAISPPKIMRYPLRSGYASPFSSLSAGPDGVPVPVILQSPLK